MLNWTIAMPPFLTRALLFLTLIVRLSPSGPGRGFQQVDSPDVMIAEPAGGAAVQGTLSITGTANPADFFFYELSFRYAGGPEDPWFVIAESFTPVDSDTLGEWDTFAITDGDYDLRLLVVLEDSSILEFVVEQVRVRNYSQVETSTAGPFATPTASETPDLTAIFTPSSTPTITPTSTMAPSATPLPPNPAEIGPGEISSSLARGAAGVLAVFVLIGLYASIRSLRRR
jgi:hypothetical protein